MPPAPSPQPGGIAVTDVSRSFGHVAAVRHATFTAEPGRITALIGPNGSGKTTLMLMLASLLTPDRGTLTIGGHDPVTEPQQVRRIIGWMPDVLGSWPTLTTRATLEMLGRMYDLDRSEAHLRAAELINLVDLTPQADQPTRVLSRGQKQRLSLARALVHNPQILVLDEPASGLDPAARVHLRQLLTRLAAEGTTILISSHVLAELDGLAHTAVYLTQGTTASAEAITRATTRTRTWRIRSLDPAALRKALHALGVSESRGAAAASDALVDIATEQDAADLLSSLVARDVPVTAFAPAVGDMEHTFLDLTKGDAQ